jgi:hypothetical protein
MGRLHFLRRKEGRINYRLKEASLALEIVKQHPLADLGPVRNTVHSGAGIPVAGKFPQRAGQNPLGRQASRLRLHAKPGVFRHGLENADIEPSKAILIETGPHSKTINEPHGSF